MDGTGDINNNAGNPVGADANYLSYLVRLLRTQNGKGEVWRVLLEEPLSQRVHRFDDLQGLLAFLRAQTGQDRQPGGNRGASTRTQAAGHSFGAYGVDEEVDLDRAQQEQE